MLVSFKDCIATETRPLLQGARLTAWELQQLGIPCTLITDNMAGHLMATGQVDAVIVGASNIVGRPMAMELLLAGCTVTVTHRFTKDLAGHVGRADLVVKVSKPTEDEAKQQGIKYGVGKFPWTASGRAPPKR